MRRTFSKLDGSRRKPAGTLLRPSDVSGTCFRDAMFAIAGQILCIRPIVAQTPLEACISDKGDVVNLAQLTAVAPQICPPFQPVQDLCRIGLLPSRHHVRFAKHLFCCAVRLSLSFIRTASVLPSARSLLVLLRGCARLKLSRTSAGRQVLKFQGELKRDLETDLSWRLRAAQVPSFERAAGKLFEVKKV